MHIKRIWCTFATSLTKTSNSKIMQVKKPRLADLITAFENSEPVLWSHVAPYRKSLKLYIERTEFTKVLFVATWISNAVQGGILFTADSLLDYNGPEELLLDSWAEL